MCVSNQLTWTVKLQLQCNVYERRSKPWHHRSWTRAVYERQEDRSQCQCPSREPMHINCINWSQSLHFHHLHHQWISVIINVHANNTVHKVNTFIKQTTPWAVKCHFCITDCTVVQHCDHTFLSEMSSNRTIILLLLKWLNLTLTKLKPLNPLIWNVGCMIMSRRYAPMLLERRLIYNNSGLFIYWCF